MGPFIQKIFTSVVLNWQALLPTRTSLISRGAKDVMRHAIWDLWSINLPMNTLVFTSYLKSGVWIEKVWIGGVVEKRLRTTVSYQILRQTLRLEHSHVTKLTMSYTPAYSKSIGNTIVNRHSLRTNTIFESTKCCCGKFVDELELHGLSCTNNAGRFPTHLAIISILRRSLTCNGLLSNLESVGLTNDGRRSDGLTFGPWYWGLSLVQDATDVGTFAQGHYKNSAKQAGFVAIKAEDTICQKYHDLQSNYHFQPLAIETTSVYGKSTILFWMALQRNLLLLCLVIPVSASGSTSVCPWLWSREMLPAYWPGCKFDLTLSHLFLFSCFVLPCTYRTAYDESRAWRLRL